MEFPLQPSPNIAKSRSVGDDYVRGDWAPRFTFQTLGNLSVAYVGTPRGLFVRDRDLVTIALGVEGQLTYTTSAGPLIITGVPYLTRVNDKISPYGAIATSGMALGFPTPGTWPMMNIVPALNGIRIQGYISGGTPSDVDILSIPTGTTIRVDGHISYFLK